MPAAFCVLVQLLGTSLAPGPVGEWQIEEGSGQGSSCPSGGQRAESGQRGNLLRKAAGGEASIVEMHGTCCPRV